MTSEKMLMHLFGQFEDATRDCAPVSPQDWEAVRARLIRHLNAVSTAIIEIGYVITKLNNPEMEGYLAAQTVLMNSLAFSIAFLPIGKTDDFADFHQSRVRNAFEQWAKATGNMADLLKAKKDENCPAH